MESLAARNLAGGPARVENLDDDQAVNIGEVVVSAQLFAAREGSVGRWLTDSAQHTREHWRRLRGRRPNGRDRSGWLGRIPWVGRGRV